MRFPELSLSTSDTTPEYNPVPLLVGLWRAVFVSSPEQAEVCTSSFCSSTSSSKKSCIHFSYNPISQNILHSKPGIGKGIAVALGKQGATVYVTGTSSSSSTSTQEKKHGPYATNAEVGGPGTVEETASLVTQLGGKGIAVICNHADDNQVKALAV